MSTPSLTAAQPATMRARRASSLKLLAVVALMFGFGFALVPMYDALCQLTNFNGKDQGLVTATQVQEREDTTRQVKVEFLTTVNGGRIWSFRAVQPTIEVHPGKLYTVQFVARNEQGHDVVGQAVPSVAPSNAARFLHKTECFCFRQQPFAANEEKTMPVRFMLDRDLPADVDTVTLSYTFFDVTPAATPTATSLAQPRAAQT